MSEFSENIVVYIAGYVSRKLCKKLSCDGCKAGLVCNSRVVENCKLLQRKNAVGLIYTRQSVIKISMVTERCVRFVCSCAGDTLQQQRKLRLALQVALLERIPMLNMFPDSVDAEHSCIVDV